MQRGGTVLSEYGVSMQDAVGLITAANESIQDPAKVGTAMKAMAVNMASVKANASKGTMELNKTAKALKEIAGIDVYSDKSKGQVKDMVQILDELNVKLKEGKIEQDEYLALSEALAGKEQAAVFQALMGNYETFKQIQNEFNQGLHFGSAEKENAAYVDSLEGKLNKLKEVWIDTLMVLADSDSLKGLLDTFISISEGINVFILYLLKIHDLRQYARDALQPVISNAGFQNIEIILPPLSLQQEFASKIEAIEKQKELIKQSIAETETLFNSRMDFYFD